jgi:hypothetical protein
MDVSEVCCEQDFLLRVRVLLDAVLERSQLFLDVYGSKYKKNELDTTWNER